MSCRQISSWCQILSWTTEILDDTTDKKRHPIPEETAGFASYGGVKRAEKPITKNGTMCDYRDNVWLWRNQTIWRDNVVRNSLMTLSNRDNMQNTSRISDNIIGKICEERLMNK